MNYRLVLKLTGKTLLVEAGAMLLPLLVTLLYREDLRPFLFTLPILLLVAIPLSLLSSSDHFFPREGFLAVGLIWLLLSAFGALPFYLFGTLNPQAQFQSYIDCFFEAASGFTTTGASILTEVESLPKGLLFWRSFTHWLGGMGVLVLAIALLPSLGARTLHVMRAESPGPVVSKLVPKASQSSKILYGIYCAITLMEVLCLRIAGMPWYDSITHSFATAGTGGFSVRNLSIASYQSAAIEVIVIIFTLLFSINFGLYFLLLSGKVRQVFHSDELRFFLGTVVLSATLIAINIRDYYDTLWDTIRHAAFQVSTIISTTGFSSANFDQWPEFSRMLLVILMFCGACAGSTGGGIKCSRVLLLLRCIRREIRQIIHPRSVRVVKLDGRTVEEDTLRSVLLFFATYMFITLGAALVVALDNFSFGTTFTAVAACINNVGPGLETVGPISNYAGFSGLAKLVLSLCMIIGRLEVLPILVLFSRDAWKRT